MSLTSLEKRQLLRPVEAELDRQKEKNARVKKRLRTLQGCVEEFVRVCEAFNTAGGRPTRTPQLQALMNSVKESKQV